MSEQYSSTTESSGLYIAAGFLLSIASLAVFPVPLGIGAIALGVLAAKRGNRAGIILIVVAIVLMVIGLIYGGVILNYLTHFISRGAFFVH